LFESGIPLNWGGLKIKCIIGGFVNIVIIRQFDTINADILKEPQQLPSVISKVIRVVMDMSPSFKAALCQALDSPIIIVVRFHFCRYIYWTLDRV